MNYDVIIVGAGPTGLTLGILLGQRGINVLIAEAHELPYPLPRAIHLDDETARILQSCGLHETLHAMTPCTSYEWQNGRGQTLLRFEMSLEGSQGWPQANMFNQPILEESLRARVAQLPSVSLASGLKLIDLEQDEGGVTATFARTDVREQHVARFLVGCDGANSTVRDQLGISMHDQGFFFDWLVADFELLEERVFDPSMLQICDPHRPTTLMPGGTTKQRRWEFMALPGETLEDLVDDDTFWTLMAPYSISPDNATVLRRAGYRFMARWATVWRKQRILIAGDAAHQTPPFAGQGMCAGLRDASNLAFKLELALKDIDILDTYEQERRPHAEAVIAIAMELGKVICVTDPAEAAARDALLAPLVPEVGATDVPGMPPLTGGLFDITANSGELFPQGLIEIEGRTDLADSALGSAWTLFTSGDETIDRELHEWFLSLGGRVVQIGEDFHDVTGRYGNWMDQHGVGVVLQRPDFRVFASAPSGRAHSVIHTLWRRLVDA
jgi:flavoprotein hydroxylase